MDLAGCWSVLKTILLIKTLVTSLISDAQFPGDGWEFWDSYPFFFKIIFASAKWMLGICLSRLKASGFKVRKKELKVCWPIIYLTGCMLPVREDGGGHSLKWWAWFMSLLWDLCWRYSKDSDQAPRWRRCRCKIGLLEMMSHVPRWIGQLICCI